MSRPAHTLTETNSINAPWQAPVRAFHWLIAGSMVGAAILTSHGDIGHATFGWLALGAALIWQLSPYRTHSPSPTLWLVTAVLTVFNLSGVFAPYGNTHVGATLAALILAALYLATVLFESLQRVFAQTGAREEGKS